MPDRILPLGATLSPLKNTRYVRPVNGPVGPGCRFFLGESPSVVPFDCTPRWADKTHNLARNTSLQTGDTRRPWIGRRPDRPSDPPDGFGLAGPGSWRALVLPSRLVPG